MKALLLKRGPGPGIPGLNQEMGYQKFVLHPEAQEGLLIWGHPSMLDPTCQGQGLEVKNDSLEAKPEVPRFLEQYPEKGSPQGASTEAGTYFACCDPGSITGTDKRSPTRNDH